MATSAPGSGSQRARYGRGGGFPHRELLIYPVLGVQVFEKAAEQPSSAGMLHLAGKGTKARGTEAPDGFVVYAGSLARLDMVPSIHAYVAQLRAGLIEKGWLVPDGAHLLTEDYVFSSPSTAAMVMLGRTANGRIEWRSADGKSLKELQTERAEGCREPDEQMVVDAGTSHLPDSFPLADPALFR